MDPLAHRAILPRHQVLRALPLALQHPNPPLRLYLPRPRVTRVIKGTQETGRVVGTATTMATITTATARKIETTESELRLALVRLRTEGEICTSAPPISDVIFFHDN